MNVEDDIILHKFMSVFSGYDGLTNELKEVKQYLEHGDYRAAFEKLLDVYETNGGIQ